MLNYKVEKLVEDNEQNDDPEFNSHCVLPLFVGVINGIASAGVPTIH